MCVPSRSRRCTNLATALSRRMMGRQRFDSWNGSRGLISYSQTSHCPVG